MTPQFSTYPDGHEFVSQHEGQLEHEFTALRSPTGVPGVEMMAVSRRSQLVRKAVQTWSVGV
jgi:hypothetical protein